MAACCMSLASSPGEFESVIAVIAVTNRRRELILLRWITSSRPSFTQKTWLKWRQHRSRSCHSFHRLAYRVVSKKSKKGGGGVQYWNRPGQTKSAWCSYAPMAVWRCKSFTIPLPSRMSTNPCVSCPKRLGRWSDEECVVLVCSDGSVEVQIVHHTTPEPHVD